MNDATERIEKTRPRRYRRYQEYKDSGVEWLGEIPKDWEVKRLSWLTKCLDCKRIPLNAEERGRMQGNYPYWGANSIVDYVDQWLFDEELVLLGEDGAPFFDRSRPVAFHVRGKIWVNNHAHVLRPQSTVDAEFLVHALNCIDYRAFIDGSTRDKLTQSDMGAIPIQCPAVEAQRAIADFLDRETARIDGLVARKERLIELFQEKRIALITRAVTRGLDPNAPMKDSGVEWLGEIPAHWEVKRVKWVARMESGHTPDKKVDAYWNDGNIPWVSLNDTSRLKDQDYIGDTEYYTNDLGLKNSSARLLPPRSVVFSRDATIGLCAITERSMAVSQHFIAWICSEGVIPEYLLRVFDVMQGELERLTMGATLRTIGMPEVKTLTTPVPPVDEQEIIVKHIQQGCLQLDLLVAKIRQAIDNLKEFRTALISAAVTGKIDVREAAS